VNPPAFESAAARRDLLPGPVRELYPWDGRLFRHPDGVRQHLIDVGEGETLLFVHGNPTWSFYWRELIQHFSPRYRCVAVDHVGCGLSDKPQDWSYHLREHQQNLARVVEALDLREVTLVVHDWGGPIGYGAALEHKDRFRRFVVFNTLSRFGPFPLSIQSCRWPVVGPLAVRGFNAFLRFALARGTTHPERFSGAVGQGYLAPYGTWADRVAIHKFIADIPIEAEHPTAWARDSLAAGIRTLSDRPHLVVWGTQDFVFHKYFLDGWRETVPDAEFIEVADAHHFVVEDAADRIPRWMTDWLARHPLVP
jgi:haloalkane dehalogenase